MEKVLYKNDIARRIAKKYKGVTISDVKFFIDIFSEEINECVVDELKTVEIRGLFKIGVKIVKQYGIDFKSKIHYNNKEAKYVPRIFCRAAKSMRLKIKEYNSDIPENIKGDK